ncbi:hypothetical protein HDV00_000342 [Rhizophlyctis rosea]|nr:hypothetical protein HDV00_000342 [Rhizophlyctis rosea]
MPVLEIKEMRKDPVYALTYPVSPAAPFVPFPGNDVHPYSVRQFFAVHLEEHEQAERFEVAKFIWDEGLALLQQNNPMCVQYFGDALTKYLRVLDPYDPIYCNHCAQIREFVNHQLATGPPPYGSADDIALKRFVPRCNIDRDRRDIYPKPNDTHFRELLVQEEEDEANEEEMTPERRREEEQKARERFADRERRRQALLRESQTEPDEEAGDGSAWCAPIVGIAVIEDHAEYGLPEEQGGGEDGMEVETEAAMAKRKNLPSEDLPLTKRHCSIPPNPDEISSTSAAGPLGDPEIDRRNTFYFNALVVRAFMTQPDVPLGTTPTRVDQLRHVIHNLSECEELKVQASRYGSFAFWMGMYYLELEDLENARAAFDRCIKKDTWLEANKRLRRVYGFDAVPQTRRRHKYQYDAELFMFITLFRFTLRMCVPRFQAGNHTGSWRLGDIIALLSNPDADFHLLREGLMRLERNFLATSPRHSEFLPTGECYRIIFSTAELKLLMDQVATDQHGLDRQKEDKIIQISDNIAFHRRRLDDALEVTRSWSPRDIKSSREFLIAMECCELVAHFGLAAGEGGYTWEPLSWERTCGNRGCWRVFHFGNGQVGVACDPEGLRCETFVGRQDWQAPMLRPWCEEFEGMFFDCPGCGLVRYCSKACQSEDALSHFNFCKGVVERRKCAEASEGSMALLQL